MSRTLAVLMLWAVAGVAAPCAGQVSLVSQTRQIWAETTANQNLQTVSAPGFAPFVQTLALETAFSTPGGGTGTNTAVAAINCLADPNAIRASGTLTGTGGLSLVGGEPSPVFGEAAALVIVRFECAAPVLYTLSASPRPSTDPRDEYEVELSRPLTGERLFFLDETMPAQQVDLAGVLAPGLYQVHYSVELTAGAAAATQAHYTFAMGLACPADQGSPGGDPVADGLLDNNDVVVFIDRFFAGHPMADLGSTGAAPGPDGAFDNNDFVVFIDRFFAGC